jgi:cytochrome P450
MRNIVIFAFSGEPKVCKGKHLVLLKSKIATAKFLQRYANL